VLSRFSDYSAIYQSASTILRCIERSINILDEQARHDEAASDLRSTYFDFRDLVNHQLLTNSRKISLLVKETNLLSLTSSVQNEVQGDLLEKYYVPVLIEKMGYQKKSRTVPTSLGEVEVDVRAEKDEGIGWENLEKLRRKDVIIVEVRTTVNKADFASFSKKSKAIIENYRKESEIWKYDLKTESWLVACYGWTDDLKRLARNLGIKPVDASDLEKMLKPYNLLNRARPPCRKRSLK